VIHAVPDNYRQFLRLKQNAKTLEDAPIFQQGADRLPSSAEMDPMAIRGSLVAIFAVARWRLCFPAQHAASVDP
jgi:hypothetical protein